ncbi:LOW QUALITY PROTEIN: hypothetical protein Cgig2_011339 [Carnegiea gigantea]|uniref:Uncharacterized protein n=1 Tax=Carnegiea gigantea TaxID=171969 RepID=A0A9Q1Q7A2_9CARY|nr:LOW QUALITY PROTEIN: hypothetical protein Cgig2_011339 [Carnegiea gigantea]
MTRKGSLRITIRLTKHTLKPKKKKTEKKGKVENKSSEEHAYDKENEKAKEKDGLPKRPKEKGPLKRKSGKNNIDKPLSKKPKIEKSPEHLGKGDKFVQNSGGKGEEKNTSSEQNAAKNVPSKAKKKALTDRHLKAAVEKLHVFNEELSDGSNLKENDLTYECEEVNHDKDQAEGKEEATIHQSIKVDRKRNKPSLEYEGGQEGKDYAESVRSIGFASFLKVDLQQIPGKFSKWLAKSSDPYAMCFKLLDRQKFPATAFDVYVTLGVPFRGSESKNCYYSKFVLKHVKDIASLDWSQFMLDKLISNIRHYKQAKAAKGQPNKDDGGPSSNPTLALHELDSEARILATASVVDATASPKKEDHHENVLMDQAKKEMNKDGSTPSFSLGLVNHDISIKKSTKNKSKARDKVSSKKGDADYKD